MDDDDGGEGEHKEDTDAGDMTVLPETPSSGSADDVVFPFPCDVDGPSVSSTLLRSESAADVREIFDSLASPSFLLRSPSRSPSVPACARRKISAANSRARTAAWDRLGESGVAWGLDGLRSGDP